MEESGYYLAWSLTSWLAADLDAQSVVCFGSDLYGLLPNKYIVFFCVTILLCTTGRGSDTPVNFRYGCLACDNKSNPMGSDDVEKKVSANYDKRSQLDLN